MFPRPMRRRSRHHPETNQREDGSDDIAVEAWRYIIQDYSARQLSFPQDKLPALSGIAWWFAKHFPEARGDEYLAGLWRSQLPESLLWFHGLPLHANTSRPDSFLAPSWSWASLNSEYVEWSDASRDEAKAKIIWAEIKLRSSDPFGSVLAGRLTIHGCRRKAYLEPSKTHAERYHIFSGHNRFQQMSSVNAAMIAMVYLDHYNDSEQNGSSYNTAVSARQVDCMRITGCGGILIEQVDDNRSASGQVTGCIWRRIGIVMFLDGAEKEWWKGSSEDSILLE